MGDCPQISEIVLFSQFVDRFQISPLLLSKFKQSCQLPAPLKSSENLWFPDDFKGNIPTNTPPVFHVETAIISTSFQREIHVECL